MSETIRVAETQLHKLQGEFPEVPTYPHVNTDLLYKGDSEPFHITLPIAEIGRVSGNGLEYDEALVNSIAEQMQAGVGGIRGHIPDEQLANAFPVDAVLWVGHQRDGNLLYAKGYIPPGETREDVRRKKAVGGSIATSIFGQAVRETQQNNKKGWRARQFQLEQIDLAPTKRAALANRKGFVITRETMQEDRMPEVITVADVPETLREQIILASETARKAERVAEMEQQVAELRQYANIVAEIRTVLGPDTDISKTVTEYHNAMLRLTEMLGIKEFANVTVRVEEMHETVAEFKRQQFEGAVNGQIAELTKWEPKTDDGKKRVEAFRASFRRALVSELKDERAPEKIAETAKTLWDGEFQYLAETIVAALSGPAALVNGKFTPKTEPTAGRLSDEELKTAANRFAHN